MAKKTTAQHYSSQAASCWSHLQFLSYSDNKEALYYEYQDDEDHVASEPSAGDPSAAAPGPTPDTLANVPSGRIPAASAPASASAAVSATSSSGANVNLAAVSSTDGAASAAVHIPLSAAHIVLALTAQKLKRAFDNVSMQKTIRELSGGTYYL
jgi:fatty acid synthase subunit alpha, fungi type